MANFQTGGYDTKLYTICAPWSGERGPKFTRTFAPAFKNGLLGKHDDFDNLATSQTTPTHDIMDLSMMSWMYDVMLSLHIKRHYFNAMIVTPPSHPLRHTCDDHGITSWLKTSRP